MPSIHQMPLLEAVARASGANVVCVHAEGVPEDRLALGWSNPQVESVTLIPGDSLAALRLLDDPPTDTMHFFSGLHCHPYVTAALRKALAHHATVGLISESHDPRGIRGYARRVRSIADALRYRHRLSPILAMGSLGVNWYRNAGFRASTIYPFAYVTAQATPPVSVLPEPTPFRLVYVGQLIPRKGVDLLLQALSQCPDVRLDVVGSGPSSGPLKDLARRLGIVDRIDWRGTLPNHEVAGAIASCDLLILPSRFDGWGAVVNEALTAGTPVACSAACGAADLIQNTVSGSVFPSGDVTALAQTIAERAAFGRPNPANRERIREIARSFSPQMTAQYFLNVVAATRGGATAPPPPWRVQGT